jgi:hypothetical protein
MLRGLLVCDVYIAYKHATNHHQVGLGFLGSMVELLKL